jgi:hypothetical protein
MLFYKLLFWILISLFCIFTIAGCNTTTEQDYVRTQMVGEGQNGFAATVLERNWLKSQDSRNQFLLLVERQDNGSVYVVEITSQIYAHTVVNDKIYIKPYE